MNSVFSLDDGHVVSGSMDSTVRVWNVSTGECEKVLAGDIDSCGLNRQNDNYLALIKFDDGESWFTVDSVSARYRQLSKSEYVLVDGYGLIFCSKK